MDAAIGSIPDEEYTPVHYPGAVVDPDTGQLISDAQVAEVEFTAFAGTRYATTGWLVVRRVLDANTQDPLFPVWRFHPLRRGRRNGCYAGPLVMPSPVADAVAWLGVAVRAAA